MQDSISLYAPNGLLVVGLRSEGGSVMRFSYTPTTRAQKLARIYLRIKSRGLLEIGSQ